MDSKGRWDVGGLRKEQKSRLNFQKNLHTQLCFSRIVINTKGWGGKIKAPTGPQNSFSNKAGNC